MTTLQSPAALMMATLPQWQTAPYEDPGGRTRRAGPVNPRSRPLRTQEGPPQRGGIPTQMKKDTFESVGDGTPVYKEPEDNASAEEKRKHKFKSIKSVGEGESLVSEGGAASDTIDIKSIKAEDGSQISVSGGEAEIKIRGTGTAGTVKINIGGTLEFGRDGMATQINEGERGKNGKLVWERCNGSKETLFAWKDGLITNGGSGDEEQEFIIRAGCGTAAQGD